MKKQIINALTLGMMLVAIIVVAGAASANAQGSNSMKVHIPFDYSVEDKKLPAGKYIFHRINGSTIQIQSEDSKTNMLVPIAYRVTPRENNNTLKAVFNRYGDNYFLSQVWTETEQGRQLLESKAERKLKKEAEVAKGKIKKETVEIAATVE
jgi:hypothetical protein